MRRRLNLYGNHRGGASIVNGLSQDTVRRYDRTWVLADPKEDRADRMAEMVRRRFPQTDPRPLRATALEALAQSGEADVLVLAVDSMADLTEALAARQPQQRATFQIVGRGPGGNAGVRLALQGTLAPGDETAAGALNLLGNLGGMSRTGSSRQLTLEDPLTAMLLRPIRDLAVRQTVLHLANPEYEPWDLSLGPLCVVLGSDAFPLVAADGSGSDRYSERRDLALETASAIPDRHWAHRRGRDRGAVVAVTEPTKRIIHFVKVTRNRQDRRRIAGVTTFETAVREQPAAFTD